MKPQEIKQAINEKIIEFRIALDSQKANKEVVSLYWEIKQLQSVLIRLN